MSDDAYGRQSYEKDAKDTKKIEYFTFMTQDFSFFV